MYRSLFAAVMVLALLGGGLLHAVVPHDDGVVGHTHGTSSHELIWSSLHGALHNEDRQAVIPSVSFEVSIAILVFFFALPTLRPRELKTQEFLRRGVAKCRRFR